MTEKTHLLGTTDITPQWLLEHEVIKDLGSGLKILGRGKLSRALIIKAHRFSESAKQAIEKAGGKAIVIESQSVSSPSN